mgnify:CR=1 FL=1
MNERSTSVILVLPREKRKKPTDLPGILVHSHGPFTWGQDAATAVYNSVVLEEVTNMAYSIRQLNPMVKPVDNRCWTGITYVNTEVMLTMVKVKS